MTEHTLARALQCLAPVRDSRVVVGGTAHRLFPQHEFGQDPGFELLTTEDVDLAAPLELQHGGERPLLEQLERAGFSEEVQGAEYPAYTYRLPEGEYGYLQFIAPLTGSGKLRSGQQDRVMRFFGIHAEKLRYVDLLLHALNGILVYLLLIHAPWSLSVQSGEISTIVRVVNPVAFLVQKLLVLPDRGDKRAKDLLYIFDTLSVFANALDELGRNAEALLPAISDKAKRKLNDSAARYCFVESDHSRNAAAIATEQRRRPPDSAQLVAACELGLRRVLRPLIARS